MHKSSDQRIWKAIERGEIKPEEYLAQVPRPGGVWDSDWYNNASPSAQMNHVQDANLLDDIRAAAHPSKETMDAAHSSPWPYQNPSVRGEALKGDVRFALQHPDGVKNHPSGMGYGADPHDLKMLQARKQFELRKKLGPVGARVASSPAEEEVAKEAPGLLRRAGRTMREHPYLTAAGIAVPLVGGALLTRHKMKKEATDENDEATKAKTAESLHGSSRSDRPEIIRKTLEKHIKGVHPDVSQSSVHVDRPLFGLMSPQAQIAMKDKSGKNIFEGGEGDDDHMWSHGTTDLTIKKKLLRDKYEAELDSMYLKPEYQGRGIGGSAFKRMTGALGELGVDHAGLMADDQGKAVWAKMPGVEFGTYEKVMAPISNRMWRLRHEGPATTWGDAPSKYSPEFLKQWSPRTAGFIRYEMDIPQDKSMNKVSTVEELQAALEKISKSRWAAVMDETLSAAQDAWKAGDQAKAHQLIAEARQIGSTVGKAGVKLREIRPLGQGGEATAKLMAGDLVHQHAPGEGMAAVKFINPVHGIRSPDIFGGVRPKDEEEALKLFRDYHLPQRVLENAVLPEALSAKNYGMFMQRSAKAGDVDAMRRGGVEMQQFMPFEAPGGVAEQLGRTVKAHPKVKSYEQLYSSKKDKQRLWDVAENRDNVRLNDIGEPRVIDSRFDPLSSGTLVGKVDTPNDIGRDRFTHQAGADVLRSLREGENASPGYGVVRVGPNLPPSYSPSSSSVREAPKAAVPPAPKVPAPAPHVPAPKREPVKTEVPASPPPSVAGPSPDVSDEKFNGTDAAILAGLAVPPVAAGAYALHRHMKNKAENDNQVQKAASVTWAAFFDEAQKIATAEQEHGNAGIGALGLGAGIAGSMGAGSMQQYHGRRMQQGIDIERELYGADSLASNLRGAAKVPVFEHELANQLGGGGYLGKSNINFMKGIGRDVAHDLPHVVMPPGRPMAASVLAHEFGHAGIDEHALGRALQHPGAGIASKGVPKLFGGLGGVAAGRYIDDPYTAAAVSAAAPALLGVPMLAAEAIASYKGMKGLRAAGANPAALQQARRTLGHAFGTYGAEALRNSASGLAGFGVGRLSRAVVDPNSQG